MQAMKRLHKFRFKHVEQAAEAQPPEQKDRMKARLRRKRNTYRGINILEISFTSAFSKVI